MTFAPLCARCRLDCKQAKWIKILRCPQFQGRKDEEVKDKGTKSRADHGAGNQENGGNK